MDARERALSEIRAVLARRPPLRQALAEVANALQALPRHTGVYFYVLRGGWLELEAHAGRDTEHVRIPVGEGICGLSARTRQTVVVDDVRADARYLACNLETRSEIVVPIVRGDRTLAQIDVDSDFEAAFGEGDRAFLERLAPLLEPLFT